MFSSLRSKVWFKDVAGFLAAYVFVVQMLTGILSMQMAYAADGDPQICYGRGVADTENDDHAQHKAHAVCDVCTFASTVSFTPQSTDVEGIEPPHTSFLISAPYKTHTALLHSPRLSQGPPHIA